MSIFDILVRARIGNSQGFALKTHWEKIYQKKAPESVSWYRAHLETSLELITKTASARSPAIIDVGGGESTLVDDLLARGYRNVSVLDVSGTALEVTKRRLRGLAENVCWIAGDITTIELEADSFDVWHDRAVFHFLTSSRQRLAYVRQVARSVRAGGHVLVSTFGPKGPTKWRPRRSALRCKLSP